MAGGFWVAFGIHGYRITVPDKHAFMPIVKTVTANGAWFDNYALACDLDPFHIVAVAGGFAVRVFSAANRPLAPSVQRLLRGPPSS